MSVNNIKGRFRKLFHYLCLHESCLTYSIRRAADSCRVPWRCFLPHYVREIFLVTNLMWLCIKTTSQKRQNTPINPAKKHDVFQMWTKQKKSYSNRTLLFLKELWVHKEWKTGVGDMLMVIFFFSGNKVVTMPLFYMTLNVKIFDFNIKAKTITSPTNISEMFLILLKTNKPSVMK